MSRMTSETDAATGHVWRAAPPGQGGKNERVCERCGSRRSVAHPDIKCPGADRSVAIETSHDYDPI